MVEQCYSILYTINVHNYATTKVANTHQINKKEEKKKNTQLLNAPLKSGLSMAFSESLVLASTLTYSWVTGSSDRMCSGNCALVTMKLLMSRYRTEEKRRKMGNEIKKKKTGRSDLI